MSHCYILLYCVELKECEECVCVRLGRGKKGNQLGLWDVNYVWSVLMMRDVPIRNPALDPSERMFMCC